MVCYRGSPPRSIQTFNGKEECLSGEEFVRERDLEVGQPCSSKLESYVIVEDGNRELGPEDFLFGNNTHALLL